MVARETSLPDALEQADIRASPEALARVERYVRILLERALPLGYIGPHEADRLIPRHITESGALGAHLGADDSLIDVGSGAGLPGLVLACLGWDVDLVESSERRAAFLRETVAELGLAARVHPLRAEDAGRSMLREAADAVVARALAAPAVALELCLPLARVDGSVFIATTPKSADGTDLAKIAVLLGGGAPEWRELAVPGADPPRCVMIVKKFRPTPERFPRRSGVPKRRPLG